MKINKKYIWICLIALMTVSTVSATSNPTLPSYIEANNYFTSANITAPGYTDKLATQIKTDHSAWYYDIWAQGNAKIISVYFSDHKAVYYDDNGKEVSPSTGLTLIESYKGVAVGNESTVTNSAINNSTVSNTTASTESSCPNCQKSTTSTVAVNNGSSLTADQQKQLDEFMSYFDGKEEVTVDGIEEQAIKSFFGGN